jgi:hypothetical protein
MLYFTLDPADSNVHERTHFCHTQLQRPKQIHPAPSHHLNILLFLRQGAASWIEREAMRAATLHRAWLFELRICNL